MPGLQTTGLSSTQRSCCALCRLYHLCEGLFSPENGIMDDLILSMAGSTHD
ncbi:uncharacterized protein PHALS_05340 [Plasmopara halstedii]|uniref:Uncharacterized protein n=1 Tax=Plasmopara halstedii TaxID=4781 RepID=A0A0P1AAU1_PLAHL|nr:uncharacterized protein PHALS_05340 [Plasmopara halstedii]CEG37560.1 hypothetical protein PHALS_05340 [Plasmopara halstedii]|eukprot:XP_024573929.1 hypothetical protein PHALS_05340 [Plasmopara halstedii]